MDIKTYYTAPPQEIFEDIKINAIKVWSQYDKPEQREYRDSKIDRIKDLKNIEDNAWYIVAMFDLSNQAKLLTLVKPDTAAMILDALNTGHY